MNILEILRQGDFVSGEEIAGILKISRAGVHKQVSKLRASGYAITGTNNSGYMLLSRPDLISREEIQYHIRKNGLPEHNIFYYPVTGSTQDEAKAIAEKDIKMPVIVIAGRQTGSYGRRRRQWAAPEGGLWVSLILKPDILPDRAPQLTFAASLAVSRAVEKVAGLRSMIKWPNDLTFQGKKLAGVLTEMSAEVGRLNWVIIGIGINVNNAIPEGLKDVAVSLASADKGKTSRAQLLAELLKGFYELYDVLIKKGFEGIHKEYNEKSMLNNMFVKVDNNGEEIEGVVQNVDKDGFLKIRKTDGRSIKIIAGDIKMIRKA